MLRFVVLSFFSVMCLTVGHLIEPDEWPRLYDTSIVKNSDEPSTKQGISYRLPNDTFPHRYDISLSTRIDLGEFGFSGRVLILLEANTVTSVVTVHSKQLTIEQVVLKNARTQATIITLFKLNVALEFLEISTATPLAIGQNYTLDISYKGTLRSDNGGFYGSNYVNEVGMTKWLATTQFERTEARHAFPCYDEPGIRSVFGLRITHARTYHAISNMPVKEIIQDGAATVTTVYADTPIMQTYLLAFVVSDFHIKSNADTKLPSDVLQRVIGRPYYVSSGQADFALEAGIKILKSFEEHFNYNYPLPKIDQAGIPGFGSAMENWGLVTYRESLLYYDPGTQALAQKETVAAIVAHEYAHQWFGNIVSPTWWEFIWLNEGFATLYEYFGADLSYPEFRFNDLMVVRILQSVFERDAYETTRPMNTYNESPAELRSLFDFVAYDKSGCVLRMIQHALTDATFTKGLTYYFNEMQYKAADPYDLYRNWEKAAREDNKISSDIRVVDIMDSWTYQKGYPAIYVTRDESGTITVKQERFLLDRLPTSQAQSWYIPYNFVVANSADFSKTTPDGWISKHTESITISPTADRTWTTDEWVLFNKQQTGYYRVNYDDRLWGLLSNELNDGDFTNIHVLNRAQLIDDAHTFARVKQARYSTTFHLMEYLVKEMDYVPWVAANRVLLSLDKLLSGSPQYPHFQAFVLHIVQPIFERFGVRIMNNDTYLDRHARNIAVKWACYMGFEPCRESANERVKDFINDNELSRSMCNGLRHVDEAEFLAVWHKQQVSSIAFDRDLIITAMGCVENRDVLKIYLETTITNTGVYYLEPERVAVLTAVINAGIVGVEAVLEFLDEHHSAASSFYSLVVPVNNLAAWVSTADHYNLFTKLVASLIEAEHLSAAEGLTATTIAQGNMEWMSTNLPDIKWYLEDFIRRSSSSRFISSSSLLAFSLLISIVQYLIG